VATCLLWRILGGPSAGCRGSMLLRCFSSSPLLTFPCVLLLWLFLPTRLVLFLSLSRSSGKSKVTPHEVIPASLIFFFTTPPVFGLYIFSPLLSAWLKYTHVVHLNGAVLPLPLPLVVFFCFLFQGIPTSRTIFVSSFPFSCHLHKKSLVVQPNRPFLPSLFSLQRNFIFLHLRLGSPEPCFSSGLLGRCKSWR